MTVATFTYTGTAQTFTVPAGVTSVTLTCQGNYQHTYSSQFGGTAQGDLAVVAGDVLKMNLAAYNGSAGSTCSVSRSPSGPILLQATSGWDDGVDSGYGIGSVFAGLTSTSFTTGSSNVFNHTITVVYTAGGGGTNVTVPGSTATATAAANTGTVTTVRNVVVAGAVATATALALTGAATGSSAVDATYAGSTATATAQALPGAAAGVRNIAVAGSTATATAQALTGTATGGVSGSVNVPGSTATATTTALTGAVQAVRNVSTAGSTAAATALALTGTTTTAWNVTINGGAATATAQAQPGTVQTTRSATTAGTTATATAQANTGTVTTTGSVTVQGSTATATTRANTGAVDIAGPFPLVHRGALTLALPVSALTLAIPQARLELDDMTYTEGDLEPALSGHAVGTIRANHPTLTDAQFNALAPYPIDLTNATTVTTHIHKADATILTRALIRGDQGADPGSWSMPWQVGDLSCAGTWTGEVEVSWPGVRPQTFGTISFTVARAIA